MLYRERRPSCALEEFVECAWSLEGPKPVVGYAVPPDGCIDIVYDRATGVRVVGAMTSQQHFAFEAPPVLAGIRFHPGMARPFIGVSAAELTDGSMPLESNWGRELRRRLDDARCMDEASAILLGAFRPSVARPEPIHRAMAALTHANGSSDLDWIAGQANMSPRHFRRRCLEETGLTPKRLSRILRFRFASRLADQSRTPNWPAIAANAGYFDQAHLIRDFREFTGRTPMAVFSNTESAPGS